VSGRGVKHAGVGRECQTQVSDTALRRGVRREAVADVSVSVSGRGGWCQTHGGQAHGVRHGVGV
jgi:hypothetical protein